MKKFIIMAIAAVASLTVNAQSKSSQETGTFSVQPHAGVVLSNCSKYDGGSSTNYKVGFTAGVEGQYMCSDDCALSIGANYSQEGFKNSELTYKMDYISVPVTFNYYICKGLAVKTGVEVGFKVNDKVSGFGASGSSSALADLSGNPDFKAKNVVVSVPVGISYEYKKVVLDARYSYGITNILGNSNYDCKGNKFTFTLGYRF